MGEKLKRARHILARLAIVLAAFLLCYSVYCMFAVPGLCDLSKTNPKTTAFQERRKKEWEEKKLKRHIVEYWEPLSGISPHLKNAVVTAEDPNFFNHHGFDFYQIWLALKDNWEERRIVSGASTITQQLMKNLYLSPSHNPLRKWKEAILTLRVERCVSKNRILEIYLNVIEWGESTYGAEAASRRYFGKPAKALDPAESALLAAMIPNPVARNPHQWNPKLQRKKLIILKLMFRNRLLTTSQYNAAVNENIKLR